MIERHRAELSCEEVRSTRELRVETRTSHAKRLAAYQRSCEQSPAPSGTNKPALGTSDLQSACRHTDRHIGLCKLIIDHTMLQMSLWNFSEIVLETFSRFLLQWRPHRSIGLMCIECVANAAQRTG